MHKIFVWISGTVLLLIGCGGYSLLAQPESSRTTSLPPSTIVPFDQTQHKRATLTPIFFPTDTATAPPSPENISTSTPSPMPTPTLEPRWLLQGPGEIIVPILLYHHIDISPSDNLYYISPDDFERQMRLLHEWGYQTISVELLVMAIQDGAELPSKPIILTFDDGGESVFTHALPIMQKYGYTGTAYIVYNYIGINSHMDADQIRALFAAGWEIGSHGISHVDLTQRADRQKEEIIESRRMLHALLDVPVMSFSHPFGAYDGDSIYHARYAGYIAAMGLGNGTIHGHEDFFYLQRMSVTRDINLDGFALLLPWRGDLSGLPALTNVP